MHLTEKDRTELLELLHKRYGYDFTAYSEASIQRRINRFMELNKIRTAFDLKHRLLNDEHFFSHFVNEITVNVTEMFRDTAFFRSLRDKVFPYLATYPHLKIWHAGCATGEEVYSTAILLEEQNILRKTVIYATDINQEVLEKAKTAIYSLHDIREYAPAYIQAGGIHHFSDYYKVEDKKAVFHQALKKNVIFSMHNLVTDTSFNEFNLVVCRNVLIYFRKELQERVIGLFYESLAPLGFLALGNKENMHFSRYKDNFEVIDKKERIYRKIS